jgi:hypothetical protein
MFGLKNFILLLVLYTPVHVIKGEHFVPVNTGNPYNPMNIIVTSTLIDNLELEENDEIGVFDGNVCVGYALYNGGGMLAISTSMMDPSSGKKDGFKIGNPIAFRIWKQKSNFEYNIVNARYNALFDTVFIPLGTAFVELNTSLDWQKPNIQRQQSFTIKENAGFNEIVGKVNVESFNELVYMLLQNETNNPFSIDPSTGIISINNENLIDYNKTKSYNLQVKVYYEFNEALSDSALCTINIVKTPPSIINIKNDTAIVGTLYKKIIEIKNSSSRDLSVIPSTLPNWLKISVVNSDEIVFEGTPGTTDIGDFKVSFLVSDNTYVLKEDFTIKTIQEYTPPKILLKNNPTNGPFQIELSNIQEGDNYTLIIQNTKGVVVYASTLSSLDNANIPFDLSGKPKGLYLVEIKNSNFSSVQKLLIK